MRTVSCTPPLTLSQLFLGMVGLEQRLRVGRHVRLTFDHIVLKI